MAQKVITLCYRKIIDANATKAWDKLVFADSFMEFKMQAQNFSNDTPYTSYADLITHLPNAQRLSSLVTPAITGYVQQLGGVIPDLLNNIGKRFLNFSKFQFEIINSDINERTRHQVAVNFYSAPLIWHDTVGNFLLLSKYSEDSGDTAGELLTNLFQLQPYVNIHSLIIL